MVLFASAALLWAAVASALPSADPSEAPYSPHTLHMDREARSINGRGIQKRAHSSALIATDGANQYATTILFGGTPFKVIIDTGSSDTWLVGNGFQCVDPSTGKVVNIDQCGFGNVYKYGKDTTLTQSNAESGENFLVQYGSGETLTGQLGTDTVTLAGLKFKTEIGVAFSGFWDGDGSASGLVGLAFDALTSAFVGADPQQDSGQNRVSYDSILSQLFLDNKFKPEMFSLALSRDVSQSGYGGSLTIGGVPNLSDPRVNAQNKFTYTPLVVTPAVSTEHFSFYSMMVESTSWGSGSNAGHDIERLYAVDSGTSLMYMPTVVATKYNALWPSSTHHPKEGIWNVPCDATPPPFAVTIAGTKFSINPKDLIQPAGDGSGTCISTIIDNGSSPPLLLGDIFLKNVVAVFDWGNKRLGFTPRLTYDS